MRLGRHNLALAGQHRRCRAHPFPRTVLLFDVCRGLPRDEICPVRIKWQRGVICLERSWMSILRQEPAALRFCVEQVNVAIHAALSRQGADGRGFHASAGRAAAGPQSHLPRHGLLRHGGRVRNVGVEIRSVRQGCGTADRKNPRPALRHDRRRLRHQLPATNRTTSRPCARNTWPRCWRRRWSNQGDLIFGKNFSAVPHVAALSSSSEQFLTRATVSEISFT